MCGSKKQTHRSGGQNWKPRNKPTLHGQLIPTRETRTDKREDTTTLISGAGKIGQLHVKNQIGLLYHTVYKTKLKMNCVQM